MPDPGLIYKACMRRVISMKLSKIMDPYKAEIYRKKKKDNGHIKLLEKPRNRKTG